MLFSIAVLVLTIAVLAVDEARRHSRPRTRRGKMLRAGILLTLLAASAAVIVLRLRDLLSTYG